MGKKYTVSFGSEQQSSYQGKGKAELLEMFQPETWNQMDDDEKIDLLAEMGKVYSEEHGIENVPRFEQELDSSLYGGYDELTNTVSVNLDACKNPLEALDTVAHEVNHAYQKQSIDQENGRYSEKERALLKAENGIYITSGKGYDRQSYEQDSNNAGVKYVLESKENFSGKAAFQDYLHGREEHFNKVTNDYLENYHQQCASEISQVEKAYLFGYISQEEREQAISCIVDRENSIKTEMLSMQETVQKLHQEVAMNKECQMDLKNAAKEQHVKFDENIMKNCTDKKALTDLYEQNGNTLKNLNYTNGLLEKEYNEKFEQLNQYVMENNLSRETCSTDEKYLSLSNELTALQEQKDSFEYHIAELETDNMIIGQTISGESQETGVSEQADVSEEAGMGIE